MYKTGRRSGCQEMYKTQGNRCQELYKTGWKKVPGKGYSERAIEKLEVINGDEEAKPHE